MEFAEALAQFAAYQLSVQGRARATVDAYSRDLAQFAEHAQVSCLKALDRSAILHWLDAIAKQELSPRSRARKLSALRAFLAWALELSLIARDPLPRELTAPRVLHLPHALSETETTAIINAASGTSALALRDRAMLETLYATGMRVSELTGLLLLDLHLADGFALVTGKGGKQRLVPLGQYAIDSVQRYLAEARSRLCPRASALSEVFLSRRGPISRSMVFRLVKKYAQRADVKAKVSPHTFRHSCASHLLAHGADLRLVQELLGHASLTTTQIYTHIEKSRLRRVYNECHPFA